MKELFVIACILIVGGLLCSNLDRIYCLLYAYKKKFYSGSSKKFYDLYREKIYLSPFAFDEDKPKQIIWPKYISSAMICSGIECYIFIPFYKYLQMVDILWLVLVPIILNIGSFLKWQYIVKKMPVKHTFYANSNNFRVRMVVAYLGYDIDILKEDESSDVRWQIAYKSEYASEFIGDPNRSVKDVATWRQFYFGKTGCETYTRYVLELYKEDTSNQWPQRLF